MKRIGLIGFSGSGKSSLAKLAELSGFKTVDTDSVITERYGRDEFCRIIDGDDADFRAIESEVIADALKSDAEIFAFGGGFHSGHTAFEKAVSSGMKLIYLRVSFDEIKDRVTDRPLFKKLGMEQYRMLFEERAPFYSECAGFTVDADGRSPEDIWLEVRKIWNLIFR
jgi:shikimate kinase